MDPGLSPAPVATIAGPWSKRRFLMRNSPILIPAETTLPNLLPGPENIGLMNLKLPEVAPLPVD